MELIDIFTSNPLKVQLAEARKQSSRLAMHITGLNMKSAIETMDEFETEQKKNLRQKYSRSNRDIFTRIHRPIDKVFSASGGSVKVSLPEDLEKEFTVYMQAIRKSMPLRKWVQQVALPAYQIDPNGLIFIEVNRIGIPYPTYKSTQDIFYYDTDGRELKMVIFNLSIDDAKKYGLQVPNSSVILERINKSVKDNNKTKYYRIVDDVSDKIVEWDGKVINEIPELNLPNPFMKCPGIIVSDIFEFNSDLLISPDSEVVELANSLLTQNSVFEIWKNLHMFPKHWRMQSVCPTCQGNGVLAGETCKSCDGTKFQKRSSVRDEIIVPFPDSADGKISLPQAFDGYTAPAVDAWTLSTNDIDRLFNQMFETMWGYSPKSSAQVQVKLPSDNAKTATQVLDESNAKIQKLYSYSAWAESIEKFIIDLCAGLLYGSSYTGCTVKYGDRYIMEGPDEIWLKYSDARTKGASDSVLDDLMMDYLEAKFYGKPIALQVAIKKNKVQPWLHIEVAEIESIAITAIDKACKVYFSEWKSTIADMEWINKDEDTLRQELITYCEPKLAGLQQEAKDEAALNTPKPAFA